MTERPSIEPERITKPMQLLAAWLVGLIVVDAAFLVAATRLGSDSWESGALVVAAILNVPIFLAALFLLQTRFRPELQEDAYYAHYLNRRTNEVVTLNMKEYVQKEVTGMRADLRLLTDQLTTPESTAVRGYDRKLAIGLNKHLSDLRNVLKAEGISLSDYFGTGGPPSRRTIAIADYLPFENKLQMLHLAIKLGMDAYVYFDPRGEDTNEDVLIGSYGDASFPVNDDLQKLLDMEPEPADLRLFEETHLGGVGVASSS